MVTILGAGIAGLSAAYKLNEKGVTFKLYEKRSKIGGILDNFTIKGFRFDHAVHLSFATEESVREIFDQTPYIKHKPDASCFDNNLWLKHPVQNNLFPLSVKDKVGLIKSFINRPEINVNNYGDWLDFQYGYKISTKYPRRYTVKYWDTKPEELGINWIGNRMHRATLEQILEGAITDKVPNYYYAKEMRYPKQGGFISFLNPIFKEVSAELNKEALKIDLKNKKIYFKNGESNKFEKLISTIPLPELITKIKDIPKNILEASDNLKWTKVHLASFGFNKPDLVKDLWAYIYDTDIYASRFYSPSIKSSDNCPDNNSSIQFEIYERNESNRKYNKDELLENCIYALKKMKIACLDDIIVKDVRTIEYGNVVFYSEMEKDRDKILSWLESNNITLAGRFGTWDYLWSNQAMISGFEAAENLIKEKK